MNREIKFRVRWTHPESDSSGYDYIGAMESWTRGDMCQEFVALEQYTGLHDRNGKEIYEGDIVRHETGRVGTVRWNSDLYAFDFDMWAACTDQEAGVCDDAECEIIGNIHDNPELLK